MHVAGRVVGSRLGPEEQRLPGIRRVFFLLDGNEIYRSGCERVWQQKLQGQAGGTDDGDDAAVITDQTRNTRSA